MSFSRITVAKNQNYTTINNTCVKDIRLSLKAKGLFLAVMSLPPTWDFSIRGIIAIVKEGETAVYSGIKELINCGYVIRNYINENGRRVGVEYVFNEIPNCEILNLENPNLGNQNLENPNDNVLNTKENKYSSKKSKKENILIKSENSKKENLPTNDFSFESQNSHVAASQEKDVSLKETTNHKQQVAAGGKNFETENQAEVTEQANPNFITQNRNNLTAPPPPKFDFDILMDLPLNRKAAPKYKLVFEAMGKNNGILVPNFEAKPLNDNFDADWKQYISEMKAIYYFLDKENRLSEFEANDMNHLISRYPLWLKITKGITKAKDKTTYKKGSFTQPTTTVAQTVNYAEIVAKQATQDTDSKRVGFHELQGVYKDLVEKYCKAHDLPFDTFQIYFKEKAGYNIYITDHDPNEHSEKLINHLFSQYSNLKK